MSELLSLTPRNLERVGNLTSPEAAREAFAQWELRKKAATKFSQAKVMRFSREALEQASGELAASYHSSLFPKGVLVTDMTVGIGGDLISFARRGPAQGFEIDQDRADMAKLNLQALGLESAVLVEDGLRWLENSANQWVFADPARRVEGRRTVRPDEFHPDPVKIAALGQRQMLCAIKLTPLLSDPFLTSLNARLEFISADGECKEVLAICGSKAVPGRFAVHASSMERLAECSPKVSVPTPDSFFFDADPAAVRAHCLGGICERYRLSCLADSNGYLTGPEDVRSVWLRGYRVLYEGPGDFKTTKRKLSEFSSATPVLKQRSTGLDLQKLRSMLKFTGQRQLTVACYLRKSHVRHVILEPASQMSQILQS